MKELWNSNSLSSVLMSHPEYSTTDTIHSSQDPLPNKKYTVSRVPAPGLVGLSLGSRQHKQKARVRAWARARARGLGLRARVRARARFIIMKLLPEFPVVRWDRSRTIEQSSSNLPLELVFFLH